MRALKSHPALAEARGLPLFAVGAATAEEARALGFEMVVTGAGTAQELVVHIVSALDPAAGLLLHLAGDTLAGDLRGALEEHGFRVLQSDVYRMVAATALPEDAWSSWRWARSTASYCYRRAPPDVCHPDGQARARRWHAVSPILLVAGGG